MTNTRPSLASSVGATSVNVFLGIDDDVINSASEQEVVESRSQPPEYPIKPYVSRNSRHLLLTANEKLSEVKNPWKHYKEKRWWRMGGSYFLFCLFLNAFTPAAPPSASLPQPGWPLSRPPGNIKKTVVRSRRTPNLDSVAWVAAFSQLRDGRPLRVSRIYARFAVGTIVEKHIRRSVIKTAFVWQDVQLE